MRSVLPTGGRQGDEGPVISSFEVVSPSLLISDVQVFRALALRGILLTVESQMEIIQTVERNLALINPRIHRNRRRRMRRQVEEKDGNREETRKREREIGESDFIPMTTKNPPPPEASRKCRRLEIRELIFPASSIRAALLQAHQG